MIKNNETVDILVNAKELLEVTNISLTTTGSSMWPFFKGNNTKIKLSKIKEIKKGNIYLFKKENSYILHRLTKIKALKLILKGDGNVTKEIVNKEDLIAQLVSFNNGKKEVNVTNRLYKFKVFMYNLLPRKVVIKLFKNNNDK